MRVGVLGPVQVWTDAGTPVEVGGVRVRMLLGRLALEAGGAVPVGALIDGLWGEEPPVEAAGALQALVSRLRKALRETGEVELGAGGYRLPGVRVDAQEFEDLVRQGRQELAAGRAETAAEVLGRASGLWRGPALGDVMDAPFASAVAARLDDLRATANADRFEAELRLGRHADILSELEAAGTEHPLNERLAALRVRALAAAGRQSDALAVYEEMRERLGEELGIDPSAELRDTHLALLRGELETPVARKEFAGSKLPARLTSFVGRAEELATLARQLDGSRLVTLVGPGGAGKTRLSLEAMSRYAGGPVFFVPLAEVGTPDQLADAVSGALDNARDGVTANSAARLIELLDVGAAVLLLDNCEHLITAAAELAERLLEALPQLRILATSREPLAIDGEVLCHLGPLPIPAGTPEPAAAQCSPAVQLFLDRALAVRPDFTLDEQTLTPVLEICRQLDGIPLALELAAAKLRSMSIDQIARRLDDRFRLLTSGSRTALPRQRTLLALVEWSWDLLEEPERILARRLAVFPGGANVGALEAICADEQLPAADILYVLGALVEKSLVTVSSADEPRYRMLETIRAYAADQLAGSEDNLTSRFTAHYLALAEAHEPLLRTSEQLTAVALFDAEHPNLAVALRAAVARADESAASHVRCAAEASGAAHSGGEAVENAAVQRDAVAEMRVGSTLQHALLPGEAAVDRAGTLVSGSGAAAVTTGGGRPAAPGLRGAERGGGCGDTAPESLLSAAGSGDPDALLVARLTRALFWYWGIRGMSNQFETAVADVLRLGERLPADVRAAFGVIELMGRASTDDAGTARALIEECNRTGALGFHPALPLWTSLVAVGAGEVELGERQLEQALHWPDPWVRASAHLARDVALTGRGELRAGDEERRAALRGFETTGERWGLGMALLAIGRAHSVAGEREQAIDAFGRAVVIASESGLEDDIFASRTELTRERMRGGDLAGAAHDIEAAQRQADELGHSRMAAVIGFSRAELHRRTGDVVRADAELDRLEQRIQRLPFPEAMAVSRIVVARMANRLAESSAAEARKLLPEVIAGSFVFGDVAAATQSLAQATELWAELLALEDDPAGAATALGMSEVIRGAIDEGEPRTRTLMAELTTRLGREGFDAAYSRGADLPRSQVLEQLRAQQ